MVGVLHENTEAHDWSDWALDVVSAPRSRPTLDTRIGQPTRNASPHMSDPRRLKMRSGVQESSTHDGEVCGGVQRTGKRLIPCRNADSSLAGSSVTTMSGA